MTKKNLRISVWCVLILLWCLFGLLLATAQGASLSPAQRYIISNWLDQSSRGDFTGDGRVDFKDFALAAGRKRDFVKNAVIWAKPQDDPNGQKLRERICLQNFAAYIAESNSITKVDRKQRTIELKAFYAQLWLEWSL